MKIFSLRALVVCCLLFVLIVLTSYFILHPSSFATVHAAECDPGQNLPAKEAINQLNKCAIEKNIFDDKIFNLNQITGTTDSLYTLLVGQSLLHPETDAVTAGGGAIAATGSLIANLYAVPPASGVQYFAGQMQKFNPVQPAYAQAGGIGFDALGPVQPIWTVFRNASYVGFVIVFVIMGFMIMFRAHISPQAVATVQDSIPRIVVALILVTFSYAIAGLMIDIMFLFLNIVINLLSSAGLGLTIEKANQVVFDKSILGVIVAAWKDIVATVASTIANLLDGVISLGKLGDLLKFLGGGIAGIIIGIAMLFIMFRVFLMLLMAYVMIIILTMAAPFFFLIQALPGNNGAKEWFKQMAANIAVFPTVAIMLLFAGILGGIGALGGHAGGAIGESEKVLQFPLLAGGFSPKVIGNLIGIGFLLMMPEAANMVKKAIGAQGMGGPGGVGAAIGAGIGAGAAVVGAGGRGAFGAAATRGPIGGWRRAQEAKRQEQAQLAAGLKTYTHPEGTPPKPTK